MRHMLYRAPQIWKFKVKELYKYCKQLPKEPV
jgi:hypothetical protein